MQPSILDRIKHATDLAAKTESEVRAVANDLRVRVTTWVMVGNGAALLLCLNGLLEQQICRWPVFQSLIIAFSVGIVATFVSVLLHYVESLMISDTLRDVTIQGIAGMGLAESAIALSTEFRLESAKKPLDQERLDSLSERTEAAIAAAQRVHSNLGGNSDAVRSRMRVGMLGQASLAAACLAFVFGVASALLDPRYAAAVCAAT